MKRNCVLVAACLVVIAASAARGDEAISLFDGKSLDGWDGNPDFWSVKDDAITGTTTAEKPTQGNTFLIWKKGELKDFELSLKFRITGGNSGIQFRSKDKGNWVVGGYQADFDSDNGWTGSFYEEGGRGILAKRGQKIEITENGEKQEAGATTPEKEIVDSVKKDGGWNDYVITAKGNQITFKVNGLTTVELTDNQASNAAESGILALQLHAGPPMVVQFKDIMLKELK
jgi:hypothetical protein